MISGMEPFDLLGDNGGSNPSNQSSANAIGLMSNMQLSNYTNDAVVVYKPVMPGATSPSPSSPPQAFQVLDDSILPLPQPNILIGGPVEQTKRKRGRPRKYSPDEKVIPGLRSSSSHRKQLTSSSPSGKKRGRPAGSSRKCQQALGGIGSSSNGYEFTPHTITVNAGEDISSKIISLAQSASQTVCIVSANGEISRVTVSQALTRGGSVTYEGRFQIISLTGYYTFSKSIGSTTKGLSILLSGSDGHVLGGGVAGALIAASPVKLVVGSFIEGEESLKDVKQTEVDPSSKVLTGTWSVKSPLSHGTTSECSGGPGSPFNLNNGVCNNSMQQDMGIISI